MDTKKEKNSDCKYIVSGIGPGQGGVGNFMTYLTDNFTRNKYLYAKRINLNSKILNKLYFAVSSIILNLRIGFIKNKNVIIIAYNYLNFYSLKKLIQNNNVTIYLMDNSFFCISAYNYLSIKEEECTRCLKGNWENSKKYNCKPQPTLISRNYYNKKNQLLIDIKNISFLVLSKTNKKLLSKHIDNKKINVCYFLTNDLNYELENILKTKNNNNEYVFDFIFHGSDIKSKGFDYCVKLARCMKKYNFFFPTSKIINLSNVTTGDVRWETGLRELVMKSRVVLTPSLWSNTPEAATLKSVILNGCVALIKNSFGFCNEVDNESFIELSGEIEKDSILLKKFIDNKKLRLSLQVKGRVFFKKYVNISKKHLSKYFD